MNKKLFFIILFHLGVGLVFQIQAQRWKILRYELLGGIGSVHMMGDIGGAATANRWYGVRDFRLDQTRPSASFGIRYRIYEKQALRFNLNYGYAYSSDVGSRIETRDYSFHSNLMEQSFVYEYYLVSEEMKRKSASMFNRRGMLNNFSKVALYGFAGFGLVESSTKKIPENFYRPTDTYYNSGLGLVFPLGLGLKYIIDERLGLGFEFGGRYTITDKLDGIKTLASKSNDFYYIGTFILTYRLKADRKGYPMFITRKFR